MKSVTAIIGGLFVALIVYVVVWFLARNVVDGQGAAIELVGHVLVIAVALSAGYSSFRASLRRAA